MKNFIKKEIVLVIATILAIISSFISTPKISYINFKVLILLFNLMIVIAAFKKLKVLDYIATNLLSKCKTEKNITYTLVLITFFSSMIVTNDVSLITFVPLTIIICNKSNISSMKIIIFETLAANLGSSLTPMGNPQNLYIYSHFNMKLSEFLSITLPLMLTSLIFILIIMRKESTKSISVSLNKPTLTDKKRCVLYSILLFIILLSVFNIINYIYTLIITIIVIIICDKDLFLKVDYSLLLTFIAFFIFIGNISSIKPIVFFMSNALNSRINTYLISIISSQVISNVPATILLSSFTSHARELLLGVNIGGLGTLIASLASLISYKLYVKENESQTTDYIKKFSLYNIIGLIILIPIMYLLSCIFYRIAI